MKDEDGADNKWLVRELERQIRRMWRTGPDAPRNPCYKPGGIRERAAQFVALNGRQREGQ